MNGWNLTASDVITGLLALCVGLLTFFGKRYVDKLDSLDAEAVRKHELKELEERLGQDQREMHEQNRSTLADIRNDIRELRTRVDSAFNRGSNR